MSMRGTISKRSNKEKGIMKTTFFLLAAILTCSFITLAAQASEHGERYERYERNGERHEENKFYGTVEALPQTGLDGIWRVSGRDVVVNRSTRIKEEYGKLLVGVQVEVQGGGNPFTAYEIEIKSSVR